MTDETRALLVYISEHLDEEIHRLETFIESKPILKKMFKVETIGGLEKYNELSGFYTIKKSIDKLL